MKRLLWMRDQEWKDFKTNGLSCPIFEENGKIKMRNLTTGEYEFLSRESEIAYKQIQKKRKRIKRWNSPKEVYKRKRTNDRFWRNYAIVFRESALIQALKENEDPRLESILNIRIGARDLFRMSNPNAGYQSPLVQIAGAKAILAYIEVEHLDLYQYVQSVCKWIDESF